MENSIGDIMKSIPKFEMPDIPKHSLPQVDINASNKYLHNAIADATRQSELLLRESEKQKIIKEQKEERKHQEIIDEFTKANNLLAEHSNQLCQLNSILNKKLDSINITLDMLINAIGANAQNSIQFHKEEHELSLQLVMLLKENNQSGLIEWFKQNGVTSIGVILTAIQMLI